MKHPDPENVREVANVFFMLWCKYGDQEVDMLEPNWNENHPCDTPACHAGWFAIFNGERNLNGYGYLDSADQMAENLGFEDRHDIREWAVKYSSAWGNYHGGGMFDDERAFGKKENETLTLLDIAEHWAAVADRIEALGGE
jgi:hypothetical protein